MVFYECHYDHDAIAGSSDDIVILFRAASNNNMAGWLTFGAE
jgi:hypothetical protein